MLKINTKKENKIKEENKKKSVVPRYITFLILSIILGAIFTALTSYAATIAASNISYTPPTGSGLPTNTQGAIDTIYQNMNKKLCKRATTLHTEKCENINTSSYCRADGYASDGTITYGRLGSGSTLTAGDAFDCDVNGDGTYDATNERFYYITTLEGNSNVSVLIYYNNTTNGVADNTSTSLVAYDSSNENWHGPRTGINNLPHSGQWKTRVYSNPRQIKTEKGTTPTNTGGIPTFIYSSTRLLTYQEVATVCSALKSKGGLKNCNYLMENTKYSSMSMGTYGYWLESPDTSTVTTVWCLVADFAGASRNGADGSPVLGVRPAIEVLKSDIQM